ncbi:MAG TPA: penicillin-binding transpeptidase domain-containing protein, partial [Acidobacteriota bacterium]|nr:penicillin-binding transpeptidase domain-containing protein [Acidobacteriota bacterium]
MRTRFHLGLLLAFVWIGAMVLRLVSIQVFQHEDYVARANKQRQSIITLDPERGLILDRKNRELAISLDVDSIYAIPEEMKDPEQTLRIVSRFVSVNVGDLLSLCKTKSFVWVARKISHESAERIRQMKLNGIYFTQESRRFYPNKELAAHVLGFVGLDNKGLSGIEFQYDGVIRGVPGRLSALRDAKKRLLLQGKEDSVLAPTAGRTLRLTIDAAIQHIAEQELKAVVQQQKAKAGIVIIMNPYTGEILAMANEPTFNPNAYAQFPSNRWRNRAIQDYFEPGSTFKVAVA